MPPEQLQLRAEINLDNVADQLYSAYAPVFEQLRPKKTYLEELFTSVEGIGERYAVGRARKLMILPDQLAPIEYALANRDLGVLDTKDTEAYHWTVSTVRDAERLKRRLISREINKNPDSFTETEKIILLGGLILSEQSDDIFFDEWRPAIKDSSIGQKLATEEAKNAGSAASFLPGIPDAIRWFTRIWTKQEGDLNSKDILLAPYFSTLPGVPEMIKTLDDLVVLLQNAEVKEHADDWGYKDLFLAWADCLRGRNELGETDPKVLEDDMMVALRQLDQDAPIFMIPWVEYDYDDPAGVAMAPSFRIGVKSTSEEIEELIRQENKIKNWIIKYAKDHGYVGADAVRKTYTQHRAWTAFAGLNHIVSMSSEVLPNDSDLRKKWGCYIFPDQAAHERGAKKRADAAQKVYPAEIESILAGQKLSSAESATKETESHELFHPIGVTKKGENRLGKLANLFEEAKATFGGMVVQMENTNDIELARKFLAACLYFSPREIYRDGNPTNQGYANRGRIVLNIAEKIGILTLDGEKEELVLNLDDISKLYQFWEEVTRYVDWCVNAYKRAEEASDENVEATVRQISKEFDVWIGKNGEGDKQVDTAVISHIKEKFAPKEK